MTQQDHGTILIVGAGQAGCAVALAIRQAGWAGPVVMFGEESHPPYQRPPLSKAFLKGEVEMPSLYLRQPATYERANIDLRLNVRVERIEVRSRTVVLASGEELSYAGLAG